MDRFVARGHGISSGALMGLIATQERRERAAAVRAKNPSPVRILQLRLHATGEGIAPEVKARAIAKLAALGVAAEPLPNRSYRFGDPR